MRLASVNKNDIILLSYTKLDVLYVYAYITILIKISNDFKKRILKCYLIDSIYRKIIKILYRKILYGDVDAIKLPFILGELLNLITTIV